MQGYYGTRTLIYTALCRRLLPRWRSGHAAACRAAILRFKSGPWLGVAAIAAGKLPYPSRTRKISPSTFHVVLKCESLREPWNAATSPTCFPCTIAHDELRCFQAITPALPDKTGKGASERMLLSSTLAQHLIEQVRIYSASNLACNSSAAGHIVIHVVCVGRTHRVKIRACHQSR